ncbi:LCP family protein [Actinosynnema sp. ALI-1.44]|uniref:LCP family protein n=1 Tax=Actinosynnema sp. ALI-1.44 TaxID=1933779 RepID=UPI001EDC0A4E|nr:LCP family protein [Actinosynnema sp. ALI-1.44]
MSVAVLGASGIVYAKFNDVNDGVVTTDVFEPEVQKAGVKPLDGAVDILLVGMDSREDNFGNPLPKEVLQMLHGGVSDGERNTDTMILVHIPVDGRRAVAISFPRDAWVELSGGFGKHKLNSAFVYQFNNTMKSQANVPRKQAVDEAKKQGRKNLIATIETLIGKSVTIDRYAEVNLLSFYEITKAIGGVEVCLNNPVDETKYSGAQFPAGKQTIEGAAALSFVRQRHELPNGDLDRIVRQQVFIGALAHKVLSTGVLTDLGKLNALVDAIKKSVVLSSGWDVTTFAQQMQGLSSGAIDFHTIPTLGPAKIGGADVIKVDPQQVNQFITGLTKDERKPQPPSSDKPSATSTPTTTPPGTDTKVTVDVRNASSEKGLAVAVQNILVGKGFLAGTASDATRQRTSTLFFRPGEESSAQRVSTELGGQFKLTPDTALKKGQVRAVLGDDYPVALGRTLAGQTGQPPAAQGSPAKPSTQPGSPSGQPSSTASTINADGVTCVN